LLDETSLDKMLLDKTSLDKTLLDKTSLDKTSLDETSLDKTSLDETSLDKTSLDETSLDKTLLDKTSLDKTSLDKTSLDEMSLDFTLKNHTTSGYQVSFAKSIVNHFPPKSYNLAGFEPRVSFDGYVPAAINYFDCIKGPKCKKFIFNMAITLHSLRRQGLYNTM
jgi:hypothetical protein